MKKRQINFKVILLFLIFLLIIISALYVCYNLFQDYRSKKSNNDLKEIISETHVIPTKEKTEMMLKLEELQKINSDIIGWISIEGTNIDYPVLQGTDNVYYMTHNYQKEYLKDGSLFLDASYDFDLPSSNFLIYGHNNKNNTMFAQLMKYKEESFFKEHPTIKFTTNEEDVEYEIIAAFLSRVYYKNEANVFRYYFFINAETEEEFNKFIQNSKKESLYDTEKTAQYGDKLLTLSTCSYHTTDGRFAVVARKIEK